MKQRTPNAADSPRRLYQTYETVNKCIWKNNYQLYHPFQLLAT